VTLKCHTHEGLKIWRLEKTSKVKGVSAMENKKIAIVGATGRVGQKMLEVFKDFYPDMKPILFASKKSAGQEILFKNEKYIVQELAEENITDFDYALFSAGGGVSREFAPIFADKGTIVIDNSSCWRIDKDVPLVIPEINPEELKNIPKNIIANPNCSTIQMLMALEPVRKLSKITKIVVSTYQAVSGSGQKAVDEMNNQIRQYISGEEITSQVYPNKIAFNALPHIGTFLDNGYTDEELKMVNETHKIFKDKEIIVEPTTVRVPVINGHSESVYFELEDKIDIIAIKKAINDFSGVKYHENLEMNIYPLAEYASGKYDVFAGRLRQSLFNEKGYNFWIVADNILKGAALNAVQILKKLIETEK